METSRKQVSSAVLRHPAVVAADSFFRLSAATGSGQSGTGHRDSQTKSSETENSRQRHPSGKATRGEIVEAAPTSFNYSWGQLNGENKQDKELAFEQSLGSLLTPFYKNALVSRQVKTSTYYRRMVEKEVNSRK